MSRMSVASFVILASALGACRSSLQASSQQQASKPAIATVPPAPAPAVAPAPASTSTEDAAAPIETEAVVEVRRVFAPGVAADWAVDSGRLAGLVLHVDTMTFDEPTEVVVRLAETLALSGAIGPRLELRADHEPRGVYSLRFPAVMTSAIAVERRATALAILSGYNADGTGTTVQSGSRLAVDATGGVVVQGLDRWGTLELTEDLAASAAPRSFSIAPPGRTVGQGLHLSWIVAEGAVGYDVFIARDVLCRAPVKTFTKVTATSVEATGLADGHYFACIVAIDTAGNRTLAANVGLTLEWDTTPPGAFAFAEGMPTFFRTELIDLSWTAATDAVGYRAFLTDALTCGADAVKIASADVTGTTASLANVADGLYRACVVARDGADNVTVAAPSQAISIDRSAPSLALSGVPADPSGVTSASIAVSGSEVEEYRFVFLSSGADCPAGEGYGAWTSPDVAITLEDLGTPGAKAVCVQARDEAGNESVATRVEWTRVDRVRPNLAAIVKRTVDAPLLGAPAIGQPGCGNYLLGAFYDLWGSAVSRIGNEAVLAMPCKYGDAGAQGWHMVFARWDGVAATATWDDADPNVAGVQEKFNKYTALKDASTVIDLRRLLLTSNAEGQIFGFGAVRAPTHYPPNVMPIVATSFASMSMLSYEPAKKDSLYLFRANDGTWKGATSVLEGEAFYDEGQVYLYLRTTNAPTNDKGYIVVAKSTDMLTITSPTTYLVEGYSHPYVSRKGETYLMVVKDDVQNRWVLVRGTGPETWDFANAELLHLESLIGAAGKWDDNLYASTANGEPLVPGARILGNSLFVFYQAGALTGSTPYSDARGIGVIEIPLVAY